MYPNGKHIGIVIVPLKSLIRELVKRCQARHIRAVAVIASDEMRGSEIEGSKKNQ